MGKETILKMEGIEKSFPGVKALDGVDFEVKRGEVHALLGENGAGKSTLVKIIAGVYTPDAGTILYKGKPLQLTHPKQAQDKGIGVIYQEFNLLPDLTVAQNIFIGREPRKCRGWIDEKALNREAERLFQRLGIDLDPREKVSRLSVAQQQMVEIAKALSFDCELLILDEPTAALTDAEIERLFEVIQMLKSSGVAMIYISHRLEELQRIVDRVTVLRDGRLVAQHCLQDVTVDQLIQEMVGRSLTSRFPPRPSLQRGEKVLEVSGLSCSRVLRDIHFHLYRGEILGVAGLMGAGRTELARALIGADPIDTGRIELEGRRVTIRSPIDAIRLGIGYVTEDRKKDGLALSLSVQDNMLMGSYHRYANPFGLIQSSKANQVAWGYKERMGIKTPDLNRQVSTLSGGNQQKVVLARWLNKNVKVLIVDEPTRGVDVGAKFEIYELMYKLVQQGVAIIMISSDLPEILGMSDRILVMAEGSITAELSKDEATQETIMFYATGGRQEGRDGS